MFIGGAGQTQLELVRPIARIDKMGVAIDQTGRDPTAIESDPLSRIPSGGQLLHRTHKDDLSVFGREGTTLDEAQPWPVERERRETRVKPDGVEPHGLLIRPNRSSIHICALAPIVEPESLEGGLALA